MASNGQTVTGMTVFVRVCPQTDHSASVSRRASAVLDKKGSFASSFSLKNSFISSKSRTSLLLPGSSSDRCILTPDDKTIRVLKSGAAAREGDKEYTFDKVFPEESSQEELCVNVHDHVLEVVSGYNVTFICHGASKSGKSYTMTGTKEGRGIIPHAIKSVFAHIDKIRLQEPDLYFYAELGYVELYNNTFRDLLYNHSSSSGYSGRDDGDDDSVVVINEVGELDSMFDGTNSVFASGRKNPRNSNGSLNGKDKEKEWASADEHKIQVHESKNLGVFLAGSPTLRVAVSSAQDVFHLYNSGQKVRSSRVTDTGHISSRSHAILILYLESRAFTAGGSPTPGSGEGSPDRAAGTSGATAGLRMSKLTFVDMAGADRLEISGAVGDTLVESQNINLSLNAFGDVLFALSKNAKAKQSNSGKGMQHVPYLNSKLTQLLKESLGGNAKTVMITTIHATVDYSKVTETSLQYASWARGVRGKVVRNDVNMSDRWIAETDPEILRLKKLLEERSRDFAKLRVAQLNRPPLAPLTSSFHGSSSGSLPQSPQQGSSVASSPSSSPHRAVQKRFNAEPNQMSVPESKSNGPESNALKNRISDLELTNQELKEDVARKSRQSADLSMSLKKSLELIQQQNKALTDQLNDVANEKDAQISLLSERLALLEAELAAQKDFNQGDASDALSAVNSELERAKKSAWDRYLTVTQQQEQIATLEQALALEVSRREKSSREANDKLTGQLAESQASIDEQKRALDQERANLHAALKAAENHVYEQEVQLQEQHATQAYQINSWKDKCDALQAELAARDAELSQARTQSKDFQEKLTKESRLLTAEAAKSADLQASLDMHIALVSSLKLKMATLQGHMTEETTKRVEKDGRVAELEREVAALKAELANIQSEHEAHADQLTGMLQDSSTELQNLVNLTNSKDASIKTLEARLAELVDAMAAEKLAAQQEIQAVQAQLREQVDLHQQLSSKYLQKNSEAETFDTNHRTVRTQLEEASAELALLKKKFAAQEEFLTKEKSTVSELNQALQKAHKLHEASVNQFTDELLDLNVKLQTSNNLAAELNRTISDYERQIEALRARLDDTVAISEADAIVAHEQIAALEAQLAEKQAALVRESERSRELDAQRRSLKDEVSSRESEKKQLVRQIKDLEDKLAAEVQKRKTEVEAAHELRKEALGASKSDLEEYKVISEEKIAGLERDLAASEQRTEDVAASLNDKIQDGLLALRGLERETSEKLQGKDAEIALLEAQLATSEADRVAQEAAAQNVVRVFQAEVEKLRHEVQKLQERTLDLESENQALRADLDEKEEHLRELTEQSQRQISDLQSSLDTQTALVASLRLKVDILQGSLDEESEIRQDRERRVTDLEAQNAEIESAAARLQKKLERELEDLLARYEQRGARILELEPLAPERDVKIEHLEGTLHRAEAEVRDKVERIRDLEAKLRDMQSARDKLAASHAEKVAELEAALDLSQSQRKTLEAQGKDITALKSTIAGLEQRVAAEVNDRTAEAAAYEEQIAALKDAVAEGLDTLKRAQGERDDAVADLDDRMQEYSINTEELQNALAVKETSIALLKENLVVQEQRAVSETNARIAASAAAEHAIADLKEQIAELTASLKAETEAHAFEVKHFKQQVAEKQRAADELARSLAATEAALRACEAKLAGQMERAAEDAKSRKAEMAAMTAQVATLEAEKAALAQTLTSVQAELNAAVADLSAQLSACKTKLEDQTRTLAIAENQLKLAEEKLVAQEHRTVDEINARKAEAAAYEEQVAELEYQIEDLEERLAAALEAHSTEVQTISVKITEKKRTVVELSEKLSATETKLVSANEALQQQERFTAAERDRRMAEVSTLEKQVADLDHLCTELQEEISDLERRLAAAMLTHTAEMGDLQDQLEEEKAKVAALEVGLAESREATRSVEDELEAQKIATEEEAHAHKADNIAFAEQVANLEAKIAELEDTLEKTRRMHDMSMSDLAEENLEAETRCEELSDEIADLHAELDELRSRNADLVAVLENSVSRADHEESVDALRSELEAAEELRAAQEAAGLTALRTAQAELVELVEVEANLKMEIVEINEDRKKALEAFKARVEELEAELNLRLAEIARFNEIVHDKDAEIRVLQDKLNEAEYVAKIEAEGAKSLLESAENQRKTLADAREVLHQRHRQALEDLADAKNDINDLRAEMAERAADADRLAARLAEKEAQLVAEVNARAADAADFEERIDALLAKTATLEDALRAARNECDELLEALHIKETEVARVMAESSKQLAARDSAIEKLNRQLAEAQTVENELQAQIAQLLAEKALLSANNNRLKEEVEEAVAALELAKLNGSVLEKKLAESINARTAEKEAHRIELELLEAARRVDALELDDALAKVERLSENLRLAQQHLDEERDRHMQAVKDKNAQIAELYTSMKEKDAKIEELSALADGLEAESAAHLVLANDRLAEIKAIEEQLRSLEAKLAAKVDEEARLREEAVAAEEVANGLRLSLCDAQELTVDLEHELAEAESANKLLQALCTKRDQEVAAAQARVDEVQALLEEQIAMVGTLKVKVATEEEEHRASKAALQAEIAGLKQVLANLQDEKADMADALRQAEKVSAGLEKELRHLQAQYDALRRELDESHAKSKRLSEALTTREQELDQLSNKLYDSEAAKHAAATLAEERRLECGALQTKVDDLKALLAEWQVTVADKERDLAAALKAKASLTVALSTREAEVADLAMEIQRLEDEVKTIAEESDKHARETVEAQASADELQLLLEEQIALVDSLRVKLATQERVHTAEHDADQAEIDGLKEILLDLEVTKRDLAEALAASKSSADALEKQLKDLQALHATQVDELKKLLAEASNKLAGKSDALEISQDELRALKEKVGDLIAVNQALTVAAQDRLDELNVAKDRLSDAVQQLVDLKAELALREEQLAAEVQKNDTARINLQRAEAEVAELKRQLVEADVVREVLKAECLKLDKEVAETQERADELQALLEEQVALVESLKVKLATQEDVHHTEDEGRAAEAAALRSRVLELQQAMLEAQDTIVNLSQQRRENETSIAALTKQAAEDAHKYDALKEQLAAKTKELEALKQKLQDAMSASAIRQSVSDSAIADLQATLVSLESTIAELQNSKKILTNEINEKTLVVNRLATENMELAEKVKALEEQLRTRVEAAESRVIDLNTDLDLQIAMVASLKLKLKAMQEQLEEGAHNLVHETAALEQCQAELQAAQAALRQSQFANEAKMASLLEEEASLQRVNALLTSQLQDKEQRAVASEAKVVNLTEQLNARQAELSRLEGELSGAAGASRQSLRDVESKLRDAEARVGALTADQTAQAHYIAEVDAQRKALKGEVTGKAAEVHRLEAMLETLQEECRDQAAQLAKLRVQFSAAQVRLEEEGHRRIRQLAAHEQRVSELEVAKVAAEHVQQRYEAKISALTNELNAASGSVGKRERMSL